MRWADIDMLRHVNNVAYLEYAAEAQARLAAEGAVRGDVASRVTISFLRPVLPSQEPLSVTTSFDAGVLTQEVWADSTGPAARIVSSWDSAAPPEVPQDVIGPIDLHTRAADTGKDGQVRLPKLFELVQESRVDLISRRMKGSSFGRFVVGTVEAQVYDTMPWRAEPYQVHGWVSRIGAGSFTVETVLSDAGRPLVSSSSVLVGFDLESQTSRPFTDDERASLAVLQRD